MKVILLLLCTAVLFVHCEKENTDNLDDILSNPRLLSLFDKRFDSKRTKIRDPESERRKINTPERMGGLRNPSSPPGLSLKEDEDNQDEEPPKKTNINSMEDSLGNLCQYHPNSSLIIRSKASLGAGAFFLKMFSGILQEECVDNCCYTQGCNMAIYENKDEHNCYLFNCGVPNKCLFAIHNNYTSMLFPNHVPPAESVSGHQRKHEDELQDLGGKTTQKPSTTTPVPTTRKPVELYGSCDIDWGDRCTDAKAECRDNQCKCVSGYYAKYGVCRKICKEPKFECVNKGQTGQSVPECIDEDHVCDGTPQCVDGSDEEECSPDEDDMETWRKILEKYLKGKGSSRTQKQNSMGSGTGKISKGNSNNEDWEDENEDKVGDSIRTTHTPVPQRPVIHHVPEVHPSVETPGSSEENEYDENEEDSEEKEEKEKLIETTTKKSVTPHVTQASKLNITSKMVKAAKGNNSSASSESKQNGNGLQVQEELGYEKVKVVSPTDSNQGPIVALALGLGITLMLLIFVGCRLRTVKRRIRKGRALHSNEADYLINGMYL